MRADRTLVVAVLGSDDAATARTVEELRMHAPALSVAPFTGELGGGDVVLVRAGFEAPPRWLEGLREAAYAETTIATASYAPAFGEGERLRACLGPCVYIRREAIDLVGGEALVPSPRLVEFSRLCTLHGLLHVAVGGPAAAVPGEGPPARRVERRPGALSVTIDARCLADPITGTQVHVLELIAALQRSGRARVRVLLPAQVSPDAQIALDGITGIECVVRVPRVGSRTDVAHRPYQVFSAADVRLLRRLGRRAVVTHQDLIAYENAEYFRSDDDWQEYRTFTRAALSASDAVVFFSDYVRRGAAAAGLVGGKLARVVYVGTDPHVIGAAAPRRPPALEVTDFLLCLGTDFVHKNRTFALRVFGELVRNHRWRGGLVFAGRRMPSASSAADEEAFVGLHPEVADRVVDLGEVDEAEKAWLVKHAQAILYPSVVEGFGLVPFEAARAGTLPVFAPQAALAETLPADAALIEPWNEAATAARVAAVLENAPATERVLATIVGAGKRLTWDATASELLDVYEEALALEPAQSRTMVLATAAAGRAARSRPGLTPLTRARRSFAYRAARSARRTAFAARRPRRGVVDYLFVSGPEGGARRYRCDHQAEQLRLVGVTAHVGYHGEVDLARLAGRYRTIVLYRVPWDEKVRGLLADPRGSTVLADVDDLVFDPEHVGEIRALAQLADSERAAFADAVGRLRRTLEAVDGVTVSTEPLQAHAQRVNEHVEVVHNAVGSDMVARANRVYSRTRDRRNGPVIAYLSGTPTHDADFDEAADAVLELLETDTAVEFWAVGTLTLDRRFAAFGERVRRIALLPFSRLPDLLAQIDVNLAPLEADNEFTDSKSALKYLEAGLLGVPTLASATSDFRRVIRHGENGLLARNHNEWIDGLHRLAASAELRRGLGEAARSDVLTHHTTAAQATETHRALLAVSERVDTMLRSQ